MRRRAALLLAGCAVMWGSAFHFVELALRGYSPETLAMGRCLIAAVVIGAIARRRRRPVPIRVGAGRTAVGIGGLCTAAAMLAVALGQQTVSSSIAGIVLGTVPVWTAVLVGIAGRRTQTRVRSPATLATATGMGMCAAVLPALDAPAAATAAGVSILCLAAVSHAGAIMAIPAAVAGYGAAAATSRMMLIAAATLLPCAVARFAVQPDVAATLALIELGIFPTGLAFVAFFSAVSRIGPERAAVTVYTIPVIAVVTGTVLGSHPLSAAVLLGAGCAIAAIALGTVGGASATGHPARIGSAHAAVRPADDQIAV